MPQRFNLAAMKSKEKMENRRKIYSRFMENPGISQREISEELGLTPGTVCRHTKAIKLGWRPEVGK